MSTERLPVVDATALGDELRLLAADRRRQILSNLIWNVKGDAGDDELVPRIQWNEDGSNRERIMTHLVDTHAPMLAETDHVEHDPERGSLRYAGDERFESLIETIKEFER